MQHLHNSSSAAPTIGGRFDRGFIDAGGSAHADDFRAGKPRQHGLHQRIIAHAVLQFSLPRLFLGIDARHARLAGNDHHPTLPGPVGELFRQLADKTFGAFSSRRDFDPALLKTHQPHVALQRALDRKIALFAGERDECREIR